MELFHPLIISLFYRLRLYYVMNFLAMPTSALGSFVPRFIVSLFRAFVC
jgi:hypothetical protein